MSNILRCIFGYHYTDIPNHIPASVGITTQGMLVSTQLLKVRFPVWGIWQLLLSKHALSVMTRET